jgi:uncharacterized protein YecT (DUF1311 family)
MFFRIPDTRGRTLYMSRLSLLRTLAAIVFAHLVTPVWSQSSAGNPPTTAEFENIQPHGFDWMLSYQNRLAADLVKDPNFAVVDKYVISALKVQRDFDGPGTHILLRDKFLAVFSGSRSGPSTPEPITVRLGRYVTASNCEGEPCQTRAFLWVDTLRGIALCVLVHPPSTELPAKGPAALIYSRQLKMKFLKESYLPDQFWFDFRDWSYNRSLPLVMTQRYVNEFNAMQVLLHDQDACKNLYTTRDAEICNQEGQDAADADLNALLSQIRLRLTPDATGTSLLHDSEQAWTAYRDKTCKAAFNQFGGGTGAPVASGECSVRLTQQYVRELQTDYYVMLFD